jgi:hypothetical protein
MKTIVGILGLLLFAGTCIAGDLIRTIVPPFPDGWKDQGGACIAGSLGVEKSCDYSIGVVKKDNHRFLYFGKSAPRTDPKKARWFVTDQMPYPKAPTGFQVVYGLCERNSRRDDTIIAVVKTTDTEWHTVVRSAYKANLETGLFEKISIKGLRCGNEGWGL